MVKLFDKYIFPEGLYYSKDHLWVKIEDGRVRIGVTDLYQQVTGNVLFFMAMPKGRILEYGKTLGMIETEKQVRHLKSPLTGKILEVNDILKKRPMLLNNDPFGEGWMVVVQPTKLDIEIANLMNTEEQLKPFVELEIPKINF
jgi:glycine cleavage system H protein